MIEIVKVMGQKLIMLLAFLLVKNGWYKLLKLREKEKLSSQQRGIGARNGGGEKSWVANKWYRRPKWRGREKLGSQ